MKRLIIIFASIVALLTISCTSNKKYNNDCIFPEISLNKFVDSETKLSDVFDNSTIIQLETEDDCLIGGRTTKVIKSNDRFFVQSMNEVLMFDALGKFICKLSKVGNGPEEYTDLHDFDIVPQYNEIWVSSDKSIIRYKIPSMEFCGKIPLSFFANKIKYVGKEMFIALTPDDKVFNLCSISGDVLESYLDKDLANSGERAVQFVKIGDNIVSQLFNSNTAVCYNVENDSFSMRDILSSDNDRISTTEVNKQFYDKYGYLDFSKEVQDKYIGIIGFRKINNQTIMSLRYPKSELAVIIDNGKCVKEYVVNPSDRCPLIDDIFNCQDPLFLMSFASCESDDSFLFVVPNDNPELNPFLLEVTEFK